MPASFTQIFPAAQRMLFFALGAILLFAIGGCTKESAAPTEISRDAPSAAKDAADAPTASHSKSAPRALRRTIALGTVVTLEASGAEAEAALTETIARLRELDALLNAENPSSDIARINAAAGKAPVPIAPETERLLSRSVLYSDRTGGAWDITIGPLSRLWRDALARETVPEAAAVEAARARVDWRRLEVAGGHAYLSAAGMIIDPGGALKGLAIDEARRIFAAHRIESGLISLGTSSLCAMGEKTPGRPWQIALRHPRQDAAPPLGVLALSHALLTVSGDYEHFFSAKGRRYHHIIDPRTGYPTENGVAEIVLTLSPEDPDAGLTADILSTALFVLGEDGTALSAPSLLPDGASLLFIAPDGTITPHGAPLPLAP